jgi:hypothetical protein
VKKTSVYLTDAELERLAWLAAREGASQAEIIRKAITAYVPDGRGDRNFAGLGTAEGPGDSVADYEEEDLLEGLGED